MALRINPGKYITKSQETKGLLTAESGELTCPSGLFPAALQLRDDHTLKSPEKETRLLRGWKGEVSNADLQAPSCFSALTCRG